jgi:hypothetical protein
VDSFGSRQDPELRQRSQERDLVGPCGVCKVLLQHALTIACSRFDSAYGLPRSQTMMDGSKVKAMESAASYQGSTNPDLTFV